MASLVEVPRSQWAQLRDLYRNDWPKGAAAYCALDTQLTYPELSDIFSFKVYCPDGDFNNGMVATSDRSDYFQLFIYPLNDIAKVEESLLRTDIINWNRGVAVPFASTEALECLKRLRKDLKINVHGDNNVAWKYLLSRDSPQYTISCPENTYVGPLKPEHIETIDKTWAYHCKGSYSFFEILMNFGLTYVLYTSDDHSPLAWLAVNEVGAISHLFCLEEHRRKRYADYIIKYALNDVLSKRKDMLAYTVDDNLKAQNLFKKLGFEMVGLEYWTYISKMK